MKKIILFFCLIFFLNNSFAETLNYKDLDKLSKINSFVDEEGKSYPIENIENKKNSIVIIYNHGSTNDHKKDSCKKNPSPGYIWQGAVVPAILKLHNQTIKDNKILIYRVCSGVKGMSLKNQKKYKKQLKENGKIELVDEFKNLKRQKIILNEVEKLTSLGFENIILSGYSAGAWASLNLQSRFPEKIKGTIAINPAFAGKKHEWKKKYPEWGAFRKMQVDIMNNSQTLNALVFAHNKDKWEDQETLSFLKNFKDLNFVDYSDLKPTSCTWADVDRKMESDKGHSIPQSKCFTKYVEKNNYFINYIETLF